MIDARFRTRLAGGPYAAGGRRFTVELCRIPGGHLLEVVDLDLAYAIGPPGLLLDDDLRLAGHVGHVTPPILAIAARFLIDHTATDPLELEPFAL